MVFFRYLANILQHSRLNGCFHEDYENKTANAGVDWGQNWQWYTVFGHLEFGCPNQLK